MDPFPCSTSCFCQKDVFWSMMSFSGPHYILIQFLFLAHLFFLSASHLFVATLLSGYVCVRVGVCVPCSLLHLILSNQMSPCFFSPLSPCHAPVSMHNLREHVYRLHPFRKPSLTNMEVHNSFSMFCHVLCPVVCCWGFQIPEHCWMRLSDWSDGVASMSSLAPLRVIKATRQISCLC